MTRSGAKICDALSAVVFDPPEITQRQGASWTGLAADAVEILRHQPFAYGLISRFHLLIASERAERYDGETSVDGLPLSRRRNFSRKLSFVPAGSRFHGWQKPRVLARTIYFYIDPSTSLADPALGFDTIAFEPRLFFEDAELWQIALALKAQIANPSPSATLAAEALGGALTRSLVRLQRGIPSPMPVAYGGLAGWQQKRAVDYIEANLDKPVSLATLADLVRLSPYHFARAFKHSLGAPPHRYHTQRRIARAKALLAAPGRSVTEIALAVGFAETSSFSAAFRKATGLTPTAFRRDGG